MPRRSLLLLCSETSRFKQFKNYVGSKETVTKRRMKTNRGKRRERKSNTPRPLPSVCLFRSSLNTCVFPLFNIRMEEEVEKVEKKFESGKKGGLQTVLLTNFTQVKNSL